MKLTLKAAKRKGKIAISHKNYINIMRSITVTYLLRGSQGYCEKKEGDQPKTNNILTINLTHLTPTFSAEIEFYHCK